MSIYSFLSRFKPGPPKTQIFAIKMQKLQKVEKRDRDQSSITATMKKPIEATHSLYKGSIVKTDREKDKQTHK